MKIKGEIISNKSLAIMILVMISIMLIGTYAWLSYRTNRTAMVLTVGEINGMSVVLKPYQINETLDPVASYTSGKAVDVTVNNKRNVIDSFRLYYQINSIDTELIDSEFKYTITKSTDGTNYEVIKTGNFSSATSNSELEIYKESVPGNNTTYLYKVYLWIDSTGTNQANMQGKLFNGELRAEVSVNVSKTVRITWNDNNDNEGIRPTSVVMTLNGGTNPETIELNAGNNWTGTISNLIINNTYTWSVPEITRYKSSMNTNGDTTIVMLTKKEYNTLTISYVYLAGGVAHEPYVTTILEGESFSVTSPTIPGYTAYPAVVSGTMPAHNASQMVTYMAEE